MSTINSTKMSVIEYCNTNGIQWQPVQLVQKRPTMCFGVMPKSNDFYGSTMLSDEEFAKRKSNVAKYQHIWISTVKVQCYRLISMTPSTIIPV